MSRPNPTKRARHIAAPFRVSESEHAALVRVMTARRMSRVELMVYLIQQEDQRIQQATEVVE